MRRALAALAVLVFAYPLGSCNPDQGQDARREIRELHEEIRRLNAQFDALAERVGRLSVRCDRWRHELAIDGRNEIDSL